MKAKKIVWILIAALVLQYVIPFTVYATEGDTTLREDVEAQMSADDDEVAENADTPSPAEEEDPGNTLSLPEVNPETTEQAEATEPAPATEEAVEEVTAEEETPEESEENGTTAELPKGTLLLADATVMYGERGDNLHGNLDALFRPELETEEGILPLTGEDAAENYELSYKFFVTEIIEVQNTEETVPVVTQTGVAEGETFPVNTEQFELLEGDVLEEIPAGTNVTAVVCARNTETEDAEALFASTTFTVEKRAVRIRFDRTEDVSISKKDAPEDGIFVLPQEQMVTEHFVIEVLDAEAAVAGTESFARMEDSLLTAQEAVAGDVSMDVSDVNPEEIGFHEVPMEVTVTEAFDENYVVVEEPLGYIYVKKAMYYATFTGYNNGERRLYQLKLPNAQTVDQLLKGNNLYSAFVTQEMEGLVNTEKGSWIAGWRVSVDNHKDAWQETSTTLLASEFTSYQLEADTDYYFTAIIRKKVASNLYIEAIPNVYFDGRSHVSWNTKVKGTSAKSKAADLEIKVVYVEDEADFRNEKADESSYGNWALREGTDYTVTYKNNKNASMVLRKDEYGEYDGAYEPKYTEEKERPQIVIKGKGVYAGFSATAFFEILPRHIGRSEAAGSGTLYGYAYAATVSGIKNVYALNSKGKMASKVSPKVTKVFNYYDINRKYYSSKVTLKKGTDYTPVLYRYDENYNQWVKMADPDPNRITQEGMYLYTAWGAGNYCGIAYGGQYETLEFCDGTNGTVHPSCASYQGTDTIPSAQFLVAKDTYMDLSKAKISIGKSKINYDGLYHYGSDFKIKVTIGSGKDKRTLTEGEDYTLVFDGVDYRYLSSYNSSTRIYSTGYESAVYEGSVKIANQYTVSIKAVDGSEFFGQKTGGKVRIKGLRLSASGWKYQKTYEYSPKNIEVKLSVNVKSANARKLREVNGINAIKRTNYTPPAYAWASTYGINDGKPGTYPINIWAVGDGIDHDYQPKVSYTIKKISLSKAIKKGYISFSFGHSDYNAGGSYPDSMTVFVYGTTGSNKTTPTWSSNNPGKMHYNNEKKNVYTERGNIQLTLTASNHKKSGADAYIKVSAKGLFTGSATVAQNGSRFSYTINPITLYDKTLYAPEYIKEYGVTTKYVDGNEGDVYAVVETGKAPGAKLTKPKATVYQAYYKNATDYHNDRLSLVKVPSSRYRAVNAGDVGKNACQVKIENTRTTSLVNGINFENVYANDLYTIYDSKATIVSATVQYNGVNYSFPEDALTEIPFEGRQIRFDRKAGEGVLSVTLKDGTVLNASHFTVTYGTNIAAKKNGGSFTITLKRNNEGDYTYGGSKTFKFTIGAAAPNIM